MVRSILIADNGVYGRPAANPIWVPPAHAALQHLIDTNADPATATASHRRRDQPSAHQQDRMSSRAEREQGHCRAGPMQGMDMTDSLGLG